MPMTLWSCEKTYLERKLRRRGVDVVVAVGMAVIVGRWRGPPRSPWAVGRSRPHSCPIISPGVPWPSVSWLRFCSASCSALPLLEFFFGLVDRHVAAHLVMAPAAQLGADQLVLARRVGVEPDRDRQARARRPA